MPDDYSTIDSNEDGHLSEWEQEYYDSVEELEDVDSFVWKEVK